MSNEKGKHTISIEIPKDENGMIGRECLKCEEYFKLKPGTGLNTDQCHCPYCDYKGKYDTFWTKAQLEFAKSIATQKAYDEIVKPGLDEMMNMFKDWENQTRNSLIQFKLTRAHTNIKFPIKLYTEKDLETSVTCDNCGLEFAIYGVFTRCPDCKELNAFLVYEKSLELIKKKLDVFSKPEIPDDIVEISLHSILTGAISAFDGLGKELKKRKSEYYPLKPRNLFQNILLLDKKLHSKISDQHSNFELLTEYFQLRHIIEHNVGVIDMEFIQILPKYKHLLGRKYPLKISDLYVFIKLMEELGTIVKNDFLKKG